MKRFAPLPNENLYTPSQISNQSTEEWWHSYRTGEPVTPKPFKISTLPPTQIFEFRSHRTTRYGRPILVFVNIITGEEGITFFNGTNRTQRKNKVGEHYSTGAGCQFLTKKYSNFRKFWKEAVGTPPRSWSRVHHELKPRLKGKFFTGTVTPKRTKKGEVYLELTKLRLVENNAQKLHKECIKSA